MKLLYIGPGEYLDWVTICGQVNHLSM